MPEYKLVYGSWKLRFNEPTEPADRALRVFDLPDRLDAHGHSILDDVSGLVDTTTGQRWNPDDSREDLGRERKVRNLFGPDIPLAVIAVDRAGVQILHRLTRLDVSNVHLIRKGAPIRVDGPLWEAIWHSYQADHLYLNNWEAYYIKGLPDTELEQKYEIDQSFHYFTLCKKWWRRIETRQIDGFIPQIGDEIQYWSYDNYFAEIADNPSGDKGYVSVMQYCKRKDFWDSPLFTFKKKIFNEDSLERWERNYENLWLDGDPTAALEDYFGYPLNPLPQWRRTRLDLACECLASGNLFMVNFDDCRIHDAPLPAGRLQQCEVEYLKTRGEPQTDQIYRDFERLLGHVEAFMTEQGLTFRRTNYSKLSFLRDYVAQQTAASGGVS